MIFVASLFLQCVVVTLMFRSNHLHFEGDGIGSHDLYPREPSQ